MLLRDLKKVANNCCFNPNKPSKDQRILLDVGNPVYWTVKAMENLRRLQELAEGSTAYNACLEEATTLLILTRAFIDDKASKKPAKARKPAPRQNSETPKVP